MVEIDDAKVENSRLKSEQATTRELLSKFEQQASKSNGEITLKLDEVQKWFGYVENQMVIQGENILETIGEKIQSSKPNLGVLEEKLAQISSGQGDLWQKLQEIKNCEKVESHSKSDRCEEV